MPGTEHPKVAGDRTQLAVMAALYEAGYGPIEDASNSQRCWLRVDPPQNNQRQRIRWARDYEIGTVAIGGLRASSGA